MYKRGFVVVGGKMRPLASGAVTRRMVSRNIVVENVSIGEGYTLNDKGEAVRERGQISYAPTGAVLDIFWANSDQLAESWASAAVLANTLLGWRSLYGAPLEWNGVSRGKISATNEFLLKKARQ